MKLIMYGTDLCPECAAAHAVLREAGIEYEYRDFSTGILPLREFLTLRDDPKYAEIFDPVREKGGIGIPCFLHPDGSITLSVK